MGWGARSVNGNGNGDKCTVLVLIFPQLYLIHLIVCVTFNTYKYFYVNYVGCRDLFVFCLFVCLVWSLTSLPSFFLLPFCFSVSICLCSVRGGEGGVPGYQCTS